MKLRLLVDNYTLIGEYYLGEPGISYYIEDEDAEGRPLRILFDMGYSDAFMKNAKAMGIDLAKVTHVIFSHGHNDHTRGLGFFCDETDTSRMRLIAHPLCFERKWEGEEESGAPYSREEMEKRFHCSLSKTPQFLTPNLCFLGEIPAIHSFEPRKPLGMTVDQDNNPIEDLVWEDSAMAYRSAKGLVIVTGCSHSGICNIVSYGKRVMREERVAAVIGGLHLFDVDERLERTVEFLEDCFSSGGAFYPCHCVSLKAKMEMAKRLPVEEVGVGLSLEFASL